MPAYIGWPRGGVPRGSEWHYLKKNFPIVWPRGGGSDPTFRSSFRICCQNFKIRKNDKVSIFSSGVCVGEKNLCAKLKSTSRRGGGRSQYLVLELVAIVLLSFISNMAKVKVQSKNSSENLVRKFSVCSQKRNEH